MTTEDELRAAARLLRNAASDARDRSDWPATVAFAHALAALFDDEAEAVDQHVDNAVTYADDPDVPDDEELCSSELHALAVAEALLTTTGEETS